MRVTARPSFSSPSFVQSRSCALKPAPMTTQSVSTVAPKQSVPRMPCVVAVPAMPSARLLSTVRLCPVLVVGRGAAGSRVCLKRTHRPLHPRTSSVRPTHLPDPPCNFLANLGPEISGLPRVLPNTRGRTSAKPHPQSVVFLGRGSVRWIQRSWGMKGLCMVRE